MQQVKSSKQNVGSTVSVLSHLKKAISVQFWIWISGFIDFPKKRRHSILSDLVSTLGTMLHTSKFHCLLISHKGEV